MSQENTEKEIQIKRKAGEIIQCNLKFQMEMFYVNKCI